MEKIDEIHIWELPLETTYILLAPELQRNRIQEAVLKLGSMKNVADCLNERSRKYNLKSRYGAGNICTWKNGRPVDGIHLREWMPLWTFIELIYLCSELEDEKIKRLYEMERGLLGYKGLETGTPLMQPVMPIRVTPEFDSIIFHLMGDGCWGGKGKLSSYRQKNKRGRDQFIQKLYNTFGYFEINRFQSEVDWKVCIPSHLVRLIEKYYGIETPEARKRVPVQIMTKNWRHKIAGLAAFLVDEGNIGDAIDIYASNKPLLEDLQKICQERGYDSNIWLKAKAGYRNYTLDHYRLRISTRSAEKLHQDIAALSRDYPTCTLAQKQEKLEMIVKRQSLHRGKGTNGVAKKQILGLLAVGPKTVNELKKETLIGGQTVREHLHRLLEENKIYLVGRIGNGDIWSLAQ